MSHFWRSLLNAQGCLVFLPKLRFFLTVSTVFILPVALLWSLKWAPMDVQQGEGYRILYVHVPCAFASVIAYAVMALFSGIFLVWRIKVARFLLTASRLWG